MTAAKIELYLKPSGDELERAEGYDDVTLREQNRTTTGTRLTYTTADERYVVIGTPVKILDECDRETTGKTLTYLKAADTITIDGNEQTRTQTKGRQWTVSRRLRWPTLRTHDLTKSYGGRTVVRGVSLEVSSGEIVGLLGPNGAGKTTTFYMTVGLTAPDSGRVELDGHDVTDDPMYIRARKGIGYLPQEPSIFRGLTVEQNILAILETHGRSTRRRGARGCGSCWPS